MFLLVLLASVAAAFLIFRPIFVYIQDAKNLVRFLAPSLAAIINLWSPSQVFLSRRSLSVHQTHQRLGPVVRIQPNHISFDLSEAVSDIYAMLAR